MHARSISVSLSKVNCVKVLQSKYNLRQQHLREIRTCQREESVRDTWEEKRLKSFENNAKLIHFFMFGINKKSTQVSTSKFSSLLNI